jgi:predicted Zn-dependent protease
MRAFRRSVGAILLISALALTACDSPEERAEEHYQQALALLEEGQPERATVEFRNVFRLNGNHGAARLRFAELLREQGDIRGAIGQYLRLVEQDPRNAAGHRELAVLALEVQDLETAAVHTVRAFALDPADPGIRALKATLDYSAGDDRPAAVEMARGVLAETPGNVAAHMVLIADRLAAKAPREALAQIDAALAQVPGDEGLHLARLATLEALGDMEAVGAELEAMAALFPDNPGLGRARVQWHLRRGDPDGAERLLRAEAAARPGDPAPALAVAQFLYELRGPAAARAELEARIAAAADPRPFQRARAGLDFAEGDSAAAIAALRGLLAGAEPSDATRDLQVSLAEMLAETGGAAEGEALIATVLGADPGHVAALKLRAKLAIAADRPEQAVQDMRTAAQQAPDDPEIMTILALAHEREGARELMGERLARAVEVSGRAPEESLRYAAFLMQENRPGPAEGVVVDALRRDPQNPELLNLLGRIHLARRDWARADQVAGLLAAQGDPVATAMATALRTASLAGQGRGGEAVAALEALAGDGNAAALADLARAHLAAGDPAAAEAAVAEALADRPDDPTAHMLAAGLAALRGDAPAAEAGYRDLIAAAPERPGPHQALFALLAGQGRIAEAETALDTGIAATDGEARLVLTKAGLLEARGDIPGAIALTEDLYARDTGSDLLANNLASLLTQAGAGPEALERAFAIARRLRGTGQPHFQDTYGWILHLRGDSAAALDYLAPAAAALPENALVQFHQAEAAFALNRREAARAGYARALAAFEAGSPLPQAQVARDRLAALDAMPPAPATPGGG